MKKSLLSTNRKIFQRTGVYFILLAGMLTACHKSDVPSTPTSPSPATYSSEVITKWLTLETRLFKNATGFINAAYTRPFGYSGIAAMESLGQDNLTWHGKYNGLGALEKPDKT